jgi:hypothetical protein
MKWQMKVNLNRNTIINTVRMFILDTRIIKPFKEISKGSVVIFREPWWVLLFEMKRLYLKVNTPIFDNAQINRFNAQINSLRESGLKRTAETLELIPKLYANELVSFESNAMSKADQKLLVGFLRAAETLGKNSVTYSE